MILNRILEAKAAEVESLRLVRSIDDMRQMAESAPAPMDFRSALRPNEHGLPAVIAEIKKASPSKGVIRSDFDPEAIAVAYQAAGASAISVLTDEQFFLGSMDYLLRARLKSTLPILRKDFIIDEYQVLESRVGRADAVLLIVAALDPQTLVQLMEQTEALGMASLVEVHNEEELAIAVDCGASLIGINNRNLHTFEVNLQTTARLVERLHSMQANSRPTVVSESGIGCREDMRALGEMGVDAVLVGEALMRRQDTEAALRELIG